MVFLCTYLSAVVFVCVVFHILTASLSGCYRLNVAATVIMYCYDVVL